jgi:DNA-binding IclR family transcriptional regulator
MNSKLIKLNQLSNFTTKQPKDVGSAGKSFLILESIIDHGRPMQMSEIIAVTKISKPSAHRIVNLLVDFKLIEKNHARNGYQAGKKMLRMSHQAMKNNISRDVQNLAMEDLVLKVNETVNYGALHGLRVTYLNRVEAKWPLGLRFEIGSQVPSHCTSIGKLLLALLPEEKLDILIEAAELTRYTSHTITNSANLKKALKLIRTKEVGTDNQEFMDGVVCIAVPVKSASGKSFGAIAMSAPQARMTLEEIMKYVPELRQTAKQFTNTFI